MRDPQQITVDDPSFPALHIRPATGWLNDPNGLCLIDGRYHVFFQYNPDAPVHAAINWGHASSTDLLHWTYEPLALRRRVDAIDAAGCWTGCVVDDGGVPTAVYTAVRESARDGCVALARSDRRLIDWRQSEYAVIGPAHGSGITEARDPFVFTHSGHRYAVQGAGSPASGRPAILLYGCDDLEQWTELGTLLDGDDHVAGESVPASIWECPNLFRLDDRWVLIISRWQPGTPGDACYLIGDLDDSGDGLRFICESGGLVDDSDTFYAPQVLPTEDRTLLWGWARDTGRSDDVVRDSGWAGALTFPRELSIKDGRLASVPAIELDKLRGRPLPATEPITCHRFEIGASAGVKLRLSIDGVDRTVADEAGSVRVFVDGSMIEVFRADGSTRTVRGYPARSSHWTVDGTDVMINELVLPAPGDHRP